MRMRLKRKKSVYNEALWQPVPAEHASKIQQQLLDEFTVNPDTRKLSKTAKRFGRKVLRFSLMLHTHNNDISDSDGNGSEDISDESGESSESENDVVKKYIPSTFWGHKYFCELQAFLNF